MTSIDNLNKEGRSQQLITITSVHYVEEDGDVDKDKKVLREYFKN